MTAIDGTAIIQPTDGEGLTLQWKQEKILQGDGNKNGQASLIPSFTHSVHICSVSTVSGTEAMDWVSGKNKKVVQNNAPISGFDDLGYCCFD